MSEKKTKTSYRAKTTSLREPQQQDIILFEGQSRDVALSAHERFCSKLRQLLIFKIIIIVVICFFRPAPVAYGDSQARAELELQLLAYTTATVLQEPEPRLRLTPRLTATLDPWPTERGQGSNLHTKCFCVCK